jgi:hypothetical protein
LKHFLNRELLAPNVMTIPVDSSIVTEFRDYENLPGRFSTVRPANWDSDIRWISAADEETFELFQSAFDRLGVAAHAEEYLDLTDRVILYAGFLVVRSRCSKVHLHLDWAKTNNEAFTLLTPVSADPQGFGLTFETLTGGTSDYDYKMGEAIVFGDHFKHGTQVGEASEDIILLCFEFGTDRMEHWPKIYETVGYQVTHIRRPDGAFVTAGGRE